MVNKGIQRVCLPYQTLGFLIKRGLYRARHRREGNIYKLYEPPQTVEEPLTKAHKYTPLDCWWGKQGMWREMLVVSEKLFLSHYKRNTVLGHIWLDK